jgi:zinc transporter, ZIP family
MSLEALGITFGAGLCTSIGAAVALKIKPQDEAKFSVLLAFSAGVMGYLSFMEMMPEANEFLSTQGYSEKTASTISSGFFFGAMIFCVLVESATTWYCNRKTKQSSSPDEACEDPKHNVNKLSTAIFTAGALIAHNFPEGLITYMTYAANKNIGSRFAIAIALHNIPQGIAVALPILSATNSKIKAFGWATFSGLAQPIAAVFAIVASLKSEPSDFAKAVIFASIAGVMVFISILKLFPEAFKHSESKAGIAFIMGMMIMAISLVVMPK